MRCPFCTSTDAHSVEIDTAPNGATFGSCPRGHRFTVGE
jgi:hypothetical protein